MLSVAEQKLKGLEVHDNIDDLALYIFELLCEEFEMHNYDPIYCSARINDCIFQYDLSIEEFRKVYYFCVDDD